MEHDHEFLYLLKKLNDSLRKQNSFWWTFWRGAFNGLGLLFGTAVLAIVVIYVLTKIQGWAYVGDFAARVLELARQK